MLLRKTAILFVVLALTCGCAVKDPAQGARDPDPLFGLGERESFTVTAESLGRDFHVLVRLPRSYGESERDYPMAFLLDGGILFPMLSPYQLMLEAEGSAGEAIVVGISYGGLGYSNGNLRGTDYTAPSSEVEYFGGASDFAAFLEEQLLPQLHSRYRIDRDRTLLFGQSLGGQFAMHAALTRPSLFSTFVAINPAIHANAAYFMNLEAKPADPPVRLVMAMGSEDNPAYRESALAWIVDRQQDQAAGFILEVLELPGAFHATSAPAAYGAVVRAQVPVEDD